MNDSLFERLSDVDVTSHLHYSSFSYVPTCQQFL